MEDATGMILGVQVFIAELLVGDGEEDEVVIFAGDGVVPVPELEDDKNPVPELELELADALAELDALSPTKTPAGDTASSELSEFL